MAGGFMADGFMASDFMAGVFKKKIWIALDQTNGR
jgi:hypothetical protein